MFTVADADTIVPLTVPSFGVTSTDRVSPLFAPTVDMLSVSVRLELAAVVLRTTPFSFQTYVRVTGSASASARVAVAVTTCVGDTVVAFRLTVAVGAALRIVTAAEVTGALVNVASLAVTRTEI